MLTLPASVFAAGEADQPVAHKQAPPAIRVVAAAERELVEKLAVNGTIVAREEADAGTDLNGMIVDQLNADQGERVQKGEVLAVLDRSLLDTQLAQNEASRAQAEANIAQMQSQIADAEVGVRQAQRGARARAGRCRRRASPPRPQLDNARQRVRQRHAPSWSRPRRRVAASQAQIAVIDAQDEEHRHPDRQDRGARRRPTGWCWRATRRSAASCRRRAGRCSGIAIGDEFELAADVAETALPRLAPGMPAEVMLAGWGAPVDGKIRPHRAGGRTRRRGSA